VQLYENFYGDSGVLSDETGPDFIRVQFIEGEPDLYTHESAGREHVERMKELAAAGSGLSTYISQHPSVRHGYVTRGR
jgi:hypothetical protein